MKSSTAEENQQRSSEEYRIKRWQYKFSSRFGHFDNVVKELFIKIDTDSNGVLDPEELAAGLQLMGIPVSDKNLLDRVAKAMDLTGDGKVSLRDFRKAVKLWMCPWVESD